MSHWYEKAKARSLLAASVLGLLVATTACRREEKVEVLKSPEEIQASLKKRQAKASARSSRAPRKPQTAAAGTAQAPAKATPAPTPSAGRRAMEILATSMHADMGTTDPEGGWLYDRNGALQLDNVKVDFPVGEVILEMKGRSAFDVWPQADLNMYNRTAKKNFFPWPRDFVTTSTYFNYAKPVAPPMPPGEYLITIRYYNYRVPQDSKQKRELYVRKLTLLEAQ